MFSTKAIQIVETWKGATQNGPEILHFPKDSPNKAKTGDAGLIRTKAIFRAHAPRKRLDTAENPGTN